MEKIYTAGIIGTGRIGFTLGFDKKREQPASHTMALRGNRRIRILSAADSNEERRTLWKKHCGNAHVYGSAEDLLAAGVPDIVVVAVNEDAHLCAALAVIAAKPKLLILEKPVALNMADGMKIQQAAQAAHVPVLVNHERRFAHDYAAAAAYLKNIGSIQSIRADLWSGLRVFLAQEKSTGAYSLLHDGTHLVDIVYFFLEHLQPDAALRNPQLTCLHSDNKGAVRNLGVHYAVPVCPDIQINISGRSKFFGFGIDILGTQGRIEIGNGYARFSRMEESKLYTGFYSLAQDKSVKVPKKTGYFSNMIQNAVDFLDGSAALKSTVDTGLKTLAVLEDIVRLIEA